MTLERDKKVQVPTRYIVTNPYSYLHPSDDKSSAEFFRCSKYPKDGTHHIRIDYQKKSAADEEYQTITFENDIELGYTYDFYSAEDVNIKIRALYHTSLDTFIFSIYHYGQAMTGKTNFWVTSFKVDDIEYEIKNNW